MPDDEIRESIGVDELSRRYSEGLDLWTGKPLIRLEADGSTGTFVFREEVEDVQRAGEVDDSQDDPAE